MNAICGQIMNGVPHADVVRTSKEYFIAEQMDKK